MRDAASTRLRIETEALRLFAGQGVRETSIRDIARAAGVAEGALYRHYAGKDDLVWALFSSSYFDFAAQLQAAQAAASGLAAKLAAMVGLFCTFFDQDPVRFGFLLLVQHGQLARVPEDAETPVTVLTQVIAEAVTTGEIPDQDVTVAAAMVMGIVLQTATFKVYGRVPQPLSALAPRLSAACLNAVRSAP